MISNKLLVRKTFLCLFLTTSLCFTLTACAQKTAVYKAEAYFSSEGRAENEVIKAINNSQSSIDIAIFDFTSQPIKSAIEKATARGIKIRIIADARQAKGVHSVVPALIGEGFPVKIAKGRSGGIMHHKFAIFDNVLLLTGSYNWTDSAEHRNWENALFIADPNVIKRYQKEFDAILAKTQQSEH